MVMEVVGVGLPFNVVFDENKVNGKSMGSVLIVCCVCSPVPIAPPHPCPNSLDQQRCPVVHRIWAVACGVSFSWRNP